MLVYQQTPLWRTHRIEKKHESFQWKTTVSHPTVSHPTVSGDTAWGWFLFYLEIWKFFNKKKRNLFIVFANIRGKLKSDTKKCALFLFLMSSFNQLTNFNKFESIKPCNCCAVTLNGCISKVSTWKDEMERKVLRVNMKKTKILISGTDLDQLDWKYWQIFMLPNLAVSFPRF